MLFFLIITLLFPCTLSVQLDLDTHWEKYKLTFKKKYATEREENANHAIWEMKVKDIIKHNLEADLGLHSYKKGINKFTDMSTDEFKNKFLGLKIPKNFIRNYLPANSYKLDRILPENFDWRDRKVVTPVKDQGTCGSCWAFSAVAAIEGAVAMQKGELVDLSEQELIDCSKDYGNHGCDGGWPSNAFRYVKDNGLGASSCYPYAEKEGICRNRTTCKKINLSAYYDVPNTERYLQEYLLKYGPVSVAMDFNDNLDGYKSGIFDDPNCNGKLNHAVLLVGYGVENDTPYWTFKNSHGEDYGEGGYFRIARGKNLCKITEAASIPWI